MGIITFCPTYPHAIHSISKYPVLNEELYQGAWLNNNLDYCLYPAGLILDDNDVKVDANVNEDKYTYMNAVFGYQDKDAYVMKLHIDRTLESLYHVSDCH